MYFVDGYNISFKELIFEKECRERHGNEAVMLSEKKIRLMTKMAIYEEKTGKEDLKLSQYYRMDFVRLKVILTILSVSVGLILLFIMGCIYNVEYILAEAVNLDYKALWWKYLGIYLVILGIYVLASVVGYSLLYGKTKKNMRPYIKNMKRLPS